MAARRPRTVPPLNALFIGNSFTARPSPLGVPGLLAKLAEARDRRLEWRLISAGGASLRRHWNEGQALAAIREAASEAEPFDFVVLQEQSTLPVKNPGRMHENVRLFHEAIASTAGTRRSARLPRIALYLTWARATAPAPQTQDQITEAYTSIARDISAVVVPVGIAWQRYLTMHKGRPPVALHDKDQSHPTLAGSYLAACVFYRALFGESAQGIEIALKGLDAETQKSMQDAAELAAG